MFKSKKEQIKKYVEKGFIVVPLWFNDKNTFLDWKTGRVESEQDIESLWTNYSKTRYVTKTGKKITGNPSFNVGLLTGHEVEEGYRLMVIDLDLIKEKDENGNKFIAEDQTGNGIDKLKELEKKLGKLPSTPIQTTQSGGKQLFFKYRSDAEIRTTVSVVADYVDIRAKGGLVVIPPSMIEGKSYSWENGLSILDTELAELPEKWIQHIIGKQKEERMREDFIENFGKVKNNKESRLSRENENIRLIREKDVKRLQKILFGGEPVEKVVSCQGELGEILGQIDMRELLGLYDNFNCIFHDDEHPSATIFENQGKEEGKTYNIYYCAGCGYKGSVWKVLGAITGAGTHKIKEFLMKVYNIKLAETEERKEIIKEIEEFKRQASSSNFKDDYPNLYRKLGYSLPQFTMRLDFMKDNYMYTDEEGRPIFYSSVRKLSEMMGGHDTKRLENKITHWTLLELIFKLGDEEIREDLKERVKRHTKFGKRTEVYAVPLPTTGILQHAEEQQIRLNEIGFYNDCYNRDGVLQKLGKDITKKVYPQLKDEQLVISKETEDFTKEITLFILKTIEEKGYCLKVDIQRAFEYKGKNKLDKQLKISQNEILKAYDLEYIHLNKQLKEKLNFTENKSPKVFVKNEIL